MTSGIYQIRSIVDGKVYIGSSRNIEQRTYLHGLALRDGWHHNRKLLAAWRKHGAGNFVFEKLEECEERLLLVVEQRYLDAAFREWSYNLSFIALCPESTEEVCKGRSERAKAQHAAGTLGIKSWKQDPAEVRKRSVATRRVNGGYKTPTFEWTPERKARVVEAMRKRRAKEREQGIMSPRQQGGQIDA